MAEIIHDTGSDRWAHGEGVNWSWLHGRHCFLGPCPLCGKRTWNYGGGWRCLGPCWNDDSNPAPNMGPAPGWWLDGTRVYKDGSAWCAVGPGFINLQESVAGFGDSPAAAVSELRKEAKR